ncbi:MAG TPA: DUF4142 domain-containing protein [Rubricoccaceae bacterium]
MRLSLLLLSVVALSACSTMGQMAGPMAATATLSDPEILRVAMTSNEGEIITSQAVVGETQNAEVRQFAQDMIAMHTRLNEQGMALEIPPRENQVSASMTQNAAAQAGKIGAASGTAQDMMYMETQVTLHGHTLTMLDNVLIPNADEARLRAYLTAARPMVEEHLRRAQRIHHSMMR